MKKNRLKRIRRAVFRFFIYGSLLMAGEVCFYTITKIGRALPDFMNWFFQYNWLVDPRLNLGNVWDVPIKTLYGQASLWMFFVYGSICLFGMERAYKKIKNWNFFLRGGVYMLIVLTMECALGWVLHFLIGYDIWYYEDHLLTIFRYTSLAIAPMWFVVGLMSENLIKLVEKFAQNKIELASLRP